MGQKIIDGFGYGLGFGAAFTIIQGLMQWIAGLIASGQAHPLLR
jgi:hypothetical protein